MARKSLKPEAASFKVLECVQQQCLSCGKPISNEYYNYRHVRTVTTPNANCYRNIAWASQPRD